MDSIIKFGAKYLIAAVALVFVIAWLQASRRNKVQMAAAVAAAAIIAGVLDKLAGKIYYDPRPFVTNHVTPLVNHSADNGFPSEHTLLGVTLAAVLFAYRPKFAGLAFILAVLVGIARIAAHVHSPIDIAGSILIGITAGWAGCYIAKKLYPSKEPA